MFNSYSWNDDERNTTMKTCYSNVTHVMNEYIPVWTILKQMYDEDKENLYCNTNEDTDDFWTNEEYSNSNSNYDYESNSDYDYDYDCEQSSDSSMSDIDDYDYDSDSIVSEQSNDLNDMMVYNNKYYYV